MDKLEVLTRISKLMDEANAADNVLENHLFVRLLLDYINFLMKSGVEVNFRTFADGGFTRFDFVKCGGVE